MSPRSENIRLIDIDSKIPNLALMKLSAFFRSKGYKNVDFNVKNPCAVFASCIFRKNAARTERLLSGIGNAYKQGGGSACH